MLNTNSLILFGDSVKMIREASNLSHYQVNKLTGIKRDTLRSIERGKCIPRYGTLDLLSNIYRVNLHLLFEKKRDSVEISEFYDYMDSAILSYSTNIFEELTSRFKNIYNTNNLNKSISTNDLKMFELLINLIRDFYDEDFTDYTKNIDLILEKLHLSEICEIYNESKIYFNFIELRIVLILSSYLMRINRSSESILILISISPKLKEAILNDIHRYQMEIKILLNLSYLSFKIEEFQNSLNYANKGIMLAEDLKSVYLLPQLYGRLAVAKMQLGYSSLDYMGDVVNCLFLFDILKDKRMKLIYSKIFEEEYNVII